MQIPGRGTSAESHRGRIRMWEWVGAAIVAVAPAYAVESTSFMTAPLAFAGQIPAVALAAAGLDRQGRARVALLSAALVTAVAAFTVREVAAAAVVAVLAAIAWDVRGRTTSGRRGAALAVGLIAVLVVGSCAAFYAWRLQLPNHQAGVSAWTSAG